MKSILLAFACFAAVNCSPLQTSEQDLRKIAEDLKNETRDLLVDLDGVKHNIAIAPEIVNRTLNSNDYGISKNPKIIELEVQLKNSRSKKNVKSCQHIFDFDKRAVKQIFDFVFWLGINSELQEALQSVNELSNTLQTISANLERLQLETEIKLCTQTPEKCKLTSEYPKEIETSKNSIIELEKIPNSLIDSVIDDDFHKQVDEKINEELYPQVSECIKKLKNE